MSVKLIYFNVTARAEPIRWMLAYGGIDFVDERVERETWPSIKSRFPFGKLPVLEIDGMEMHQSVVIARYLATKLDLVPNDPKDALQCEMLVDTIFNDLRELLKEYFLESNTKLRERYRNINLPSAEEYLYRLNEIVSKNGGHFVKGKLTWTDFMFAAQADNLSYYAGKDLYIELPALRALRDKVRDLPAVQDYLKTSPKPFF